MYQGGFADGSGAEENDAVAGVEGLEELVDLAREEAARLEAQLAAHVVDHVGQAGQVGAGGVVGRKGALDAALQLAALAVVQLRPHEGHEGVVHDRTVFGPRCVHLAALDRLEQLLQ